MDLNQMKRTIMDMNGHKGRLSTAKHANVTNDTVSERTKNNDKAIQLDIIQNTFHTEETVYPLFHPVTEEMFHHIILRDGRLHFNMKFLTEGGHF